MRATPTIVTEGRAVDSRDWQVVDAPSIPGACSTDLRARIMHAPSDPGDLEHAIRGHEMIHAGWSPIDPPATLGELLGHDPANIAAVEEWRVNAIAFRAGVDSTILHDPGDVATAEKLARSRQFAPALRLVVSTHGTNAHRRALKAIRQHAPKEWQPAIQAVQRAIRRARKDHNLADRRTARVGGWQSQLDENGRRTLVDWVTRPIPRGFMATLDVVRVLEREIDNDPTPRPGEKPRETERDRRAKKRKERAALEKFREFPEFDLEGTGYESVRLLDIDHDLEHKGKQARRRIAADTGKNPRRVSRWIDDPARRVFDRKIRARGGVVLIDQSGSMKLDRADIDRLLEHAGGAIVIGYSDVGENLANVWVHAQNGKRSNSTPIGGSDNNVDGSALMYALSRRAQRRDPVLWVTDGRCYEASPHGLRPSTCAILERVVQRHNVTMLDNIDDAIRELARLARGNNPRTHVNWYVAALAKRHKEGN